MTLNRRFGISPRRRQRRPSGAAVR